MSMWPSSTPDRLLAGMTTRAIAYANRHPDNAAAQTLAAEGVATCEQARREAAEEEGSS